MSKKLFEESNIQAIANAIRAKLGGSATYLPSQMAEAISSIITPNLQSKSVTPGASEQTVSPDSSHNGLSSVVVAGDADLVAGNIKKDVNIFGVTGSYEGSASSPTLQSKSVTPGTSQQTISADNGYDGLSSVIVAGDSDLVAGNIKKNVEIFGVTGSYEGSGGGGSGGDYHRVRRYIGNELLSLDYVYDGDSLSYFDEENNEYHNIHASFDKTILAPNQTEYFRNAASNAIFILSNWLADSSEDVDLSFRFETLTPWEHGSGGAAGARILSEINGESTPPLACNTNYYSGRRVINICSGGGYSGDSNMSYLSTSETPQGDYYWIDIHVLHTGIQNVTVTMDTYDSNHENLIKQTIQSLSQGVQSNKTLHLLGRLGEGGYVDVSFRYLKVTRSIWAAIDPGEVIHYYVPCTTGIYDLVDQQVITPVNATTGEAATGYIVGPAINAA